MTCPGSQLRHHAASVSGFVSGFRVSVSGLSVGSVRVPCPRTTRTTNQHEGLVCPGSRSVE